ncbi:MAG: ATP-binding protein [Oscillospiraceae bacterium]|nr:ATP-binding protein [Oscillospiraceae bacterium]
MFDPVLLARAQTLLAERRAVRDARGKKRRDEIYGSIPDIAAIDAEMRDGLLKAVRQVFSGGPAGEGAMVDCRERNLALRAKRTELLVENNYSPGALDLLPDCPLCDDQGFSEGKPCACLRKIHADMQRRLLDSRLDIREQCFENFDLSLFSPKEDLEEKESPRERMSLLLEYCRKYARRFGGDSDNLLLRGGPGLGKTYLCACIAGVVAAGPHWVIYETVASALGIMEAEKFTRDSATEGRGARLTDCDLLLLDDLGAEFHTPFSQSAILSLLSARLSGKRQTIVTTVLGEEELRRRYPPQLASRLEAFALLPLFGGDLRRR